MEQCIPFCQGQENGTNTAHEMRDISMRLIYIVEVSDVILMAYLDAIASVHTHTSWINTKQEKQN